jgi:hypothetical protein
VLSKNFPYINDYARRVLDPEYGISYIKSFLIILLFMSLVKVGFGLVIFFIDFTFWYTSVTTAK